MKKIIIIISFIFLFSWRVSAQVTVDKPRYISLAPSTTEILFALGLDDEIVGVSFYCNYPDKAKTKEKIGSFSSPNIEKIVSLRPDYIFCTGLEQAPVINQLKRLKLKVYVADPKNTMGLLKTIIDIGKITNRDYSAQILARSIQQGLEEVGTKVRIVPEDKRPKVFIEIWHDPLTTAGGGSFIDELITIAGGVNIANDTKRPYSIFSAEEVIRRNPDYIILAYMSNEESIELVGQRLGWGGIRAVKSKKVYNDINSDILLRPGPRIATAVKELYRKLYP